MTNEEEDQMGKYVRVPESLPQSCAFCGKDFPATKINGGDPVFVGFRGSNDSYYCNEWCCANAQDLN